MAISGILDISPEKAILSRHLSAFHYARCKATAIKGMPF
jgi:hypothetical protein